MCPRATPIQTSVWHTRTATTMHDQLRRLDGCSIFQRNADTRVTGFNYHPETEARVLRSNGAFHSHLQEQVQIGRSYPCPTNLHAFIVLSEVLRAILPRLVRVETCVQGETLSNFQARPGHNEQLRNGIDGGRSDSACVLGCAKIQARDDRFAWGGHPSALIHGVDPASCRSRGMAVPPDRGWRALACRSWVQRRCRGSVGR